MEERSSVSHDELFGAYSREPDAWLLQFISNQCGKKAFESYCAQYRDKGWHVGKLLHKAFVALKQQDPTFKDEVNAFAISVLPFFFISHIGLRPRLKMSLHVILVCFL